MTYEQTIEYLFSRLPMFQRIGAAAYKEGLDNIINLCNFLGNPEKKLTCIHVAGTNGKGSTCHTLASILQEAGYKVGLYTSPHLKSFTERIRINGKEISQEFVIQFTQKIQNFIEEQKPSFFEITTAMAFEYFAQEQNDINIIEVGMGGRLDSTNVIMPILSVITSIGYDHQQFLGNTLEKIAGEKAGIIKNNIPVVISEKQSETRKVFLEKAIDKNSPILFAEDLYDKDDEKIKEYQNYFALKGIYQQKNLLGILASVKILRQQNYQISENNLINGLKNVIRNTHLKGRWQVLNQKPFIVCDTAHNLNGIEEVIKQLNILNFEKLHIILGFANDKDLSKILPLYPKTATYYFCEFNSPRSLQKNILQQTALQFGLIGKIYDNVNKALEEAQKIATDKDVIFIGGSTFVVAEIHQL